MKFPIVITGIGVVSSLADTLNETFSKILQGETGITSHDFEHLKAVPLGKITNIDFSKYITRKEQRRYSYAGCLAIYCAMEALNHAKISNTKMRSEAGIYIGVTSVGTLATEQSTEKLYTDQDYTQLIPPYLNNHFLANSPSGELSLKLETGAPHYTIGAACAAGNMGIIQACQMIELGEVPFAIAGGVSDLATSVNANLGFVGQGALSKSVENSCEKACLPLCENRPGVVIGDGCAMFILETEQRAKQRGAPILAYIDGYGSASDYNSFAEPQVDGQIRCLEKTFAKSSLKPEQIDAINLHATGTQLGDKVEMKTIQTFFANTESKLYALKGYLGHTMGAAGAIELALSIKSLQTNTIPACYTANHQAKIDIECQSPNLLTTNFASDKTIHSILNNSFGFFGINSSIIIKK
jgi:3-oxoacyl-[acyl-carrier-protein] synthase II